MRARVLTLLLLLVMLFLSAEESDAVEVLRAEKWIYSKEMAVLESAEVRLYDGSTLSADRIVLRKSVSELSCYGRVKYYKKGSALFANKLEMNYATGEYRAVEVEGYVLVESKKESVLWFFKARELRGKPGRYSLYDGRISTCSFQQPKEHSVSFSKATVVEGKRVVIVHTVNWIGDVPVFYFPVLYLPLKEEQKKYSVSVGKNKTEGRYFKINYPGAYAAGGFVAGYMLHLMEKKGTRVGLDTSYNSKFFGAKGKLKGTYMKEKRTGKKNVTFNLDQPIKRGKWTGKLGLTRNQTYIISGGDVNNANFRLNLNFKPSVSNSFVFNFNDRYNGGARASSNWSFNVSQKKKSVWKPFGSPVSYSFKSDARGINRKNQPTDSEVKTEWVLKQNLNPFNWKLSLNKRFDPDGDKFEGDRNASYLEKVPECFLNLNLNYWKKRTYDGERVYNFFINLLHVTSANVTLAQIRERRGNFFESTFVGEGKVVSKKKVDLGKNWNLDLFHTFTQTFYGTGDARMVFQPRFTLKHQARGKPGVFTLTWSQLEENGRDPLNYGRVGDSNSLNARYNYKKKKWSYNLAGGYNLITDKWLDLNGNYSYVENPLVRFNLKLSYSLERKEFNPASMTFNYQSPLGYRLENSLQVDLEEEKVKGYQLKGYFEFGNGYNLQLKGSYSKHDRLPFLKEALLTKFNKCTFVQLAWRANRKQLFLNFGLLAYPSEYMGLSKTEEGFFINSYPGKQWIQKGVTF